jgi:hypothetical protein
MTAAKTLRDETPTVRITRRLRGKLAEEMIPQVEVARQINMPQQSFARRMTGATPFDVDEITNVARVTGIRVAWLMTGEGDPFGPGGCLIGRARQDSNLRPEDYKSPTSVIIDLTAERARRRTQTRDVELPQVAKVLQFPSRMLAAA